MKSEWAPCMICFSERMCSCCLVSTMCRFLRIFIANVLDSSLFNWTLKTGRKDTWVKAFGLNRPDCITVWKLKGSQRTQMTPNYCPIRTEDILLEGQSLQATMYKQPQTSLCWILWVSTNYIQINFVPTGIGKKGIYFMFHFTSYNKSEYSTKFFLSILFHMLVAKCDHRITWDFILFTLLFHKHF